MGVFVPKSPCVKGFALGGGGALFFPPEEFLEGAVLAGEEGPAFAPAGLLGVSVTLVGGRAAGVPV